MSLILDALRRAEREKREENSPAPGILAQETSSEASPGRGWLELVPVAAVLAFALFAMLALGALFMFRAPATGTDAREPARMPALAARQAENPPANPVARERAMQRDTAVRDSRPRPSDAVSAAQASGRTASVSTPEQDAAIAALYAQPPHNVIDAPEASPSAPAVTDADIQIKTRAEIQTEDQMQTAERPGERESENESEIDVEQVLREIRAQAGNSALQAHPVALLEDLTKQFRDSVPTLMYSRHNYGSSGPSTVTINGTNLSPGQRTRGVEVREILSDSVILRFQGSDFRLRALNSWVNL
ncbi:general secretion pathway protein GspB [Congregibacter litoralis]|uniref:Type II secretion system protein GspB C-terminal domain-containing protein n=1 Tax=Congregibacter litoralis KT71 TaxID=314285 RepID=A4A414_9GAMM|nr:general secretion pathway protein GspB [Congregibacter litoralis]EAQ99437.2 hypothetical protein KT71_17246 [Congregibacter litoralis KT71]